MVRLQYLRCRELNTNHIHKYTKTYVTQGFHNIANIISTLTVKECVRLELSKTYFTGTHRFEMSEGQTRNIDMTISS